MRTILCILLLVAQVATAATINVTCDFLSISNALAVTADDGDIVNIAAGSCIISNRIATRAGKSFTIRGAGTNDTTLISGNLSYALFLNQGPGVFKVSDLNLVGSSGNSSGFIIGGGPVHIYNVKMTNVLYRGISLYNGLVEYCTFRNAGSSAQPIDYQGNQYGVWTNVSLPFGTTNAYYVENCAFYANGFSGNGYFDGYNGGQLVFRYNYCDGYTPSGGHGYDSGFSPRSWEVYNNVFTNYTSGLVLQWRGGSGVVFSNRVYGSGVSFSRIDYYRSCPPSHLYGGSPLPLGIPGQDYEINFAGFDFGTSGVGQSFPGNPTSGDLVEFGNTSFGHRFVFTNTYGNASSFSGYRGGYVVIGATAAETATNLYNASRMGAGSGTIYSSSMPTPPFVGVSLTTTSVIMRCILDDRSAGGWPAAFQTGTITSWPPSGNPVTFTNNITRWPAYAWSNTVNGAVVGIGLGDNTAECNYYITNIVQEGRDYFNDTIPSAGVYTPLVYPHPMTAFASGGSGGGSSLVPALFGSGRYQSQPSSRR